uniref:Uncharacterized protein n=1 Tax=Hormiphora californensis TaxID=1403702 RepID=A0A6C0SSV8_HORCA|nr:hypothetical protein G6P39_mgp05 [Hormiphora californensis]QIA92683.1 hypothetical protein [Hormiphora californensis]QIA92697.1 hypothetical protein [Hormiphora californensis]
MCLLFSSLYRQFSHFNVHNLYINLILFLNYLNILGCIAFPFFIFNLN